MSSSREQTVLEHMQPVIVMRYCQVCHITVHSPILHGRTRTAGLSNGLHCNTYNKASNYMILSHIESSSWFTEFTGCWALGKTTKQNLSYLVSNARVPEAYICPKLRHRSTQATTISLDRTLKKEYHEDSTYNGVSKSARHISSAELPIEPCANCRSLCTVELRISQSKEASGGFPSSRYVGLIRHILVNTCRCRDDTYAICSPRIMLSL